MLEQESSAFATVPSWKGGPDGSWSSLFGQGLKGMLALRSPSVFSLA